MKASILAASAQTYESILGQLLGRLNRLSASFSGGGSLELAMADILGCYLDVKHGMVAVRVNTSPLGDAIISKQIFEQCEKLFRSADELIHLKTGFNDQLLRFGGRFESLPSTPFFGAKKEDCADTMSDKENEARLVLVFTDAASKAEKAAAKAFATQTALDQAVNAASRALRASA